MARLAIFIDGGYSDAISRREAGVSVDYQKLVDEIAGRVRIYVSFTSGWTMMTIPSSASSLTRSKRRVTALTCL